jgi:hypothetical protein
MTAILTPWFESLVVVLVALLAFLVARWFSRLPRRYWLIGYVLPLSLILLYCVAIFEPELAVVPPISWTMIGRSRFVCFNVITTMLLSAPLTRLPHKRNRVVVCVLIAVLTAMSVVPFLAPAFNRRYLVSLKTRLDGDGVCRQSSEYTCAPAAAVTALRKLGLPAEEGELAILAHTSSLTGTEPDVLAKVLQKHYRTNGLTVEYRAFKNLDELSNACPAVAVMAFNALQDHCVAILGLHTNGVLVADPLTGLGVVPAEEFERKWLFAGIVLKRAGKEFSHSAN